MSLAIIGLGGGEILLLSLFCIVPLVLLSCAFWIWMLISAIKNKNLGESEKICWVLVIVFLHFIGALLYLIIAHSGASKPTAA
ncbi:MAG: PLDc N-terminal domain-containing protein [Verrucomicrobiota bacterium]|jgi:hypothetical protein